MKDFELIVYIVAALIYFISRNYRKVQQNRPGQQPSPVPVQEHEKPATVERRRKKEKLEAPVQPQPSKKIPYQAMKRQNLAREYKPVRKSHSPDFLKTEIESTQNFFKNLLTTEEEKQSVQIIEPEDLKPYLIPEDLKKAIIYSEIIRRPYN